MTTTRTVTKEYDAEGRLVKETEVTVTTPDATWVYQPYVQPYRHVYPYQPYIYSGSVTTTNGAHLTLHSSTNLPEEPPEPMAVPA